MCVSHSIGARIETQYVRFFSLKKTPHKIGEFSYRAKPDKVELIVK